MPVAMSITDRRVGTALLCIVGTITTTAPNINTKHTTQAKCDWQNAVICVRVRACMCMRATQWNQTKHTSHDGVQIKAIRVTAVKPDGADSKTLEVLGWIYAAPLPQHCANRRWPTPEIRMLRTLQRSLFPYILELAAVNLANSADKPWVWSDVCSLCLCGEMCSLRCVECYVAGLSPLPCRDCTVRM